MDFLCGVAGKFFTWGRRNGDCTDVFTNSAYHGWGLKRVVMFQEIGRVKFFLSLKTNKKEKPEYEKAKETKEKKRISPENELKK